MRFIATAVLGPRMFLAAPLQHSARLLSWLAMALMAALVMAAPARAANVLDYFDVTKPAGSIGTSMSYSDGGLGYSFDPNPNHYGAVTFTSKPISNNQKFQFKDITISTSYDDYNRSTSFVKITVSSNVKGQIFQSTYDPGSGWESSGPLDIDLTPGESLTIQFGANSKIPYDISFSGFQVSSSTPTLTLTSLDPATDTRLGGALITVNGANFTKTSKVVFADTEVATTFVSASQLTVKAPAAAATVKAGDKVKVKVTDGTASTSTLDFTYSAVPLGSVLSAGSPYVFTNGSAITSFKPVTLDKDKPGEGTITYAISPDLNANTGLAFNTGTGEISGTPNKVAAATSYKVTLTDSNSPSKQTSSQSFSLEVKEAAAAKLSITLKAAPKMTVNSPVTPFVIATAAGGTPPYVFETSALPKGLSLAKDGTVSGKPTEVGSYDIQIQVTDSSSPKQTLLSKDRVSLEVWLAPQTLPDDTIPAPTSAAPGGSYKPSLKQSSAKITPSLVSETTDVCTVETDGTVSFLKVGECKLAAYASATDIYDESNLVRLTIKVGAGGPTLTLTSLDPATDTRLGGTLITVNGANFTKTSKVVFADTEVATTFVSASQLTVTAPAAAATVKAGDKVKVKVTDGTASSSELDFTYSATPLGSVLSAGSPYVFTNGSAITSFKPVTLDKDKPGEGTITYAISPDLNANTGLSFDTGTGEISGKPTKAAAATTYKVTLTDSSPSKQTSSQSFSLEVKEAAVMLSASLLDPMPELTVGVAGSAFAPVKGAGGTSPYSFAITTGAAPAGLTFGTDGKLSADKPTKAGDVTFTVTVTDKDGKTVTQQVTIKVKKGTQTLAEDAIPAPTSPATGGNYTPSVKKSSANLAPNLTSTTKTICTVDTNGKVSFLTKGECKLSAQVDASDDYAASNTVTQSFTVGTGAQTLAEDAIPAPTNPAAGGNYTPSVKKSSANLAPKLTSTTPSVCTVDTNGKVSFLTKGECKLSAQAEASDDYAASNTVTQSFTVGTGAQTLAEDAIPAPTNPAAGGNYTPSVKKSSANLAPKLTSTTPSVCTVDTNGKVSFLTKGECKLSAQAEASDDYAASNTVTQSFTVGTGAQTITFDQPTSPAPALSKATLTKSTTSANQTVDFTVDSTSSGICSVSGTQVSYLKTGSCVINADAKATSDYAAATRVQRTVTVSAASTTISLVVTPTTPFVGQTVVLEATLGASTASGKITFKDGTKEIGSVDVSGGKARITSSALVAGAHKFTATYSGDDVYGSVTSSEVTITPNNRPDPTLDKNVRAIIALQSATVQRVAGTQIDQVNRRLEMLHEDEIASFTNGISISPPRETNYLPPGYVDPTQQESLSAQTPAGRALHDKMKADEQAKANSSAQSFNPLDNSPLKVWTAGSVAFGSVNISSLGVATRTHFTLGSLTAGVDTKLMEGVKGGFAVSYSSDANDIGTDGSRLSSRALTGSLYASWKITNRLFLDWTLGYGGVSFDSKRLDTNAGGFITGDRSGRMLFGSLALSYDIKDGALSYAPYARLSIIEASLNSYTEQGDANWILSYQRTTLSSQTAVLGLRGEYAMPQSWGTLSPTARVEYRRMLNGDVTQTMNYANDSATSYSLTTVGADRDMFMGSIGLKTRSDRDVTGELEYMLSGGMKSGLQGQGLRGRIRMGF